MTLSMLVVLVLEQLMTNFPIIQLIIWLIHKLMEQSISMVMTVTIDCSELMKSHSNIFSAVKVTTSSREVIKMIVLILMNVLKVKVSFTLMEALETTLLSLTLNMSRKKWHNS